MREKFFYERRAYEAVADVPLSKTIQRKPSQALILNVKGEKEIAS